MSYRKMIEIKNTTRENENYSKKLETMADTYMNDYFITCLRDYKKQLTENLRKFIEIKKCTKKDFTDSIAFAREAHEVTETIENYYSDTNQEAIQKEITEIRKLLWHYQGVYDLENEIYGSFSDFSVEECLSGNIELSSEKDIQNHVTEFQKYLVENGIQPYEKNQKNEISSKKYDKANQEKQLNTYKSILENHKEKLKNIQELTIGEVLEIVNASREIKSKVEDIYLIHQDSENLITRMKALEVLDLLEISKEAENIVPYLNTNQKEVKVKEYLNHEINSGLGKILNLNIRSIQSKIEEQEDDFIEFLYPENKNSYDYDKEKSKKSSLLSQQLDQILEKFNHQLEALENGSFEEETEIPFDFNPKFSKTLEDFHQKLETIEKNSLKFSENKEAILLDVSKKLEKVENKAKQQKQKDLGRILGNFDQKLEELKNESLEDTLESMEKTGQIEEELEWIDQEELEWVKEPIAKTPERKKRRVTEKNKQPRKISAKKNGFIEVMKTKAQQFIKVYESHKRFYFAKYEYFMDIRKLQRELNQNLKSGLTLEFLNQYQENYYQSRLRKIGRKIEKKYGKKVSKKLKRDSLILEQRNEIFQAMESLSEGFEKLLDSSVQRSDGLTFKISEMEEISEDLFYVVIGTMPVLVDIIEKNMTAVRRGERVPSLKSSILGFSAGYLGKETINEKENTNLENELFHTEEEINQIVKEPSIEKNSRPVLRISKYHYNTCQLLKNINKENIGGEEFLQICNRLRKSLRDKREHSMENTNLWYTYKASVEELNNDIRGLKRASNLDINKILQRIEKQCENYMTYYEKYQKSNQTDLFKKVQNISSSMKERGLHRKLEKDGEQSEKIVIENFEFEEDFDEDYLTFIDLDKELEIKDSSTELLPSTIRKETRMQEIKPSIKNLEVKDTIVEYPEMTIKNDTNIEKPHVVLGIQQNNQMVSFVDLNSIENYIKYLAQENSSVEYSESQSHQKAIS